MANAQSVSRDWDRVLTDIGQNQDRESFVYLYQYFAPKVKTYLLRFTGSEAQADELAQEALLLVWRKADQYMPGKAAASTWIFRIARNLFIDQRRSGKAQLELNTDSDDHYKSFIDEEAEGDHFEQGVSERDVHQALKGLPVIQAQLVYKSYFEGKSHSEIAGDMDIPIGSVKSGLRLAFKKLRAFIEQANGEERV
jgi:RNA polymerase sigma-70 factor (ECF subfamily)